MSATKCGWGLWVAVVLALFCACRKAPIALAKLERLEGTVERDHSASVGVFAPAGTGDVFSLGDGVRTGVNSRAGLRLLDRSLLSLDEKTLVRFVPRATPDDSHKLDVEFGEAEVTASASPVTIETSFGNAVIQPNGTLRMKRSVAGTRFEVIVGLATLDVGDKHAELSPTTGVEVGPDGHIVEPRISGKSAPSSDPRPAEPPEPEGNITVDVENVGARIRDEGRATFRELPQGRTAVVTGSVLELPAGGTARLRVNKDSTRLQGPARFTIGDGRRTLVQAHGGGIELAPVGAIVSVAVPGGTIRAQVGARANLRSDKAGTAVSVASGTVTLDGSQQSETLHGGEEAVLERNGRVRLSRGRGLDHADLLANAGESFVIHDPKPPTAVGIAVPAKCDGSAVVALLGPRRRELAGEKTISVELKPGSHTYSVRCVDAKGLSADIVAKGTITVMADAGTRKLAGTPPATVVDTDGRTYTVLYQNKLPSIVLRWPNAPSAGPFQLVARHANGRSEHITSNQPTHAFEPGALGEGTHVFTFEAPDRRSKATEVNISFDNATPAASIVSPANASFESGDHVQVSGTALPDSTVSVAGIDLPQDEQHRFYGEATAPTTQRALAIRFVHPVRGTHYYLRRRSGAQ